MPVTEKFAGSVTLLDQQDQLYSWLYDIVQHPDSVLITFGLYDSQLVRWLLDNCTIGVQIAVSVPPVTECTVDCPHCRAKRLKYHQRICEIVDRYPHLRWKLVQKCHVKCYCSPQLAVVGSHNLTGSDWAEQSVLVSGEAAGELWQRCIRLYRQLPKYRLE